MGALVVGVDGSDGSGTALAWAVAEAHLSGEDVTIATVVREAGMLVAEIGVDGGYASRIEHTVQQRAEAMLTQMAARHAGPGVQITPEVLRGTAPAWTLIRRATVASALVVGSRGLGAVRAFLLGSVSHQAAVHAGSTVVVVPGSFDPDTRHPKVVVGVDGSSHARAALLRAAHEARLRDAELEALLVPPAPPAMTTRSPSQATVDAYMWAGTLWHEGAERLEERVHEQEQLLAQWRHSAESHLAGELARIDPAERPAKVTTSVVGTRHPARALLDAAASGQLLVVGRRGRGGFAGMVLGSVSQQCVHHATTPVMIVPPDANAPTGDR